MAGDFAAGDVHGIGQVQGLIDRVPAAFDRDFVDQAITLPGNAAEVKASREDIKAREIAEEQDARQKNIDRGIERTEQENQALIRRQGEAAEKLKADAAAATDRVARAADDDLKEAVLKGIAARKSDKEIQRDLMPIASKVAMADDLIRPDLKNVAAFRAGNDRLQAERKRINLPNEPQLPQRPKRLTLDERRDVARAKLKAAADRREKQKEARKAKTEDRRASIKAGIKPGTPVPLAPAQVKAHSDLLEIQAKKAKDAQAQAPAGLEAREALLKTIAENDQTIAVLTNEITGLWRALGSTAKMQMAMRRNTINQLQAERTRTMSMLGGGN